MFVVIAAVALLSEPANSRECQARKGEGRDWSWRQIDGRRCWYQGKARKTKLYWRVTPSDQDEIDVLLESVWPPLSDFDKRWVGE